MSLLDIVTAPWAITPSYLLEIKGIYQTHMRGEKIDISAVEARIGRPLKNEQLAYEVVNRVAVIQMHGVTGKRMNLFTSISGGASTEIVERDFTDAINNPEVDAIILDIDSPGGTVDGTAELAKIIKDSRGIKPIAAFANGMMASAAYYIGSAADSIYASGPQAIIGSIGVISTHVDVSKAEEEEGIKTTEIYAGKYKRIDSNYEPLSQEGRQYIQDRVDYMYSVFVDAVSDHRGVPVSTVLEEMADGYIFVGQQAIDAGLIDGVRSLDSLISEMSAKAGAATVPVAIKSNEVTKVSEQKEVEITKSFIAERHPDIAAAFRDDGVDQAKIEGANSERVRILSVMDQSIPGHDDLIHELAFDGKTSGPEAAVKVLQAERVKRESVLSTIKSDAPEPLRPIAEESTIDANAPLDDRCEAAWQKDPALRSEFDDIDSYKSYVRAMENGQVKVLSKRGK